MGPDRATTTAIAKRAGVSIGSLYQYYPSKHALLTALADRHVAEATAAVDRAFDAIDALPLPQAVALVVDGLFALAGTNVAVLARELPRVGPLERLAEIELRLIARTRETLTARRPDLPDVDHAAFLVVHLLQAVVRAPAVHTMPPDARAALARETARMLVAYLGGPA